MNLFTDNTDNNDIPQPLAVTEEMLSNLNKFAHTYEEVFSNNVIFALHHDDLTRKSLLHQAALSLTEKLKQGYVINLNNEDFIKNLMFLYQYSEKKSLKELYDALPDFLRIILHFQTTKQTEHHFWINSLTTQLSVRDLMQTFNIEISGNQNSDRLALEPYCIALDAALQEFDFDNGKRLKIDVFTGLVKAKAIFLDLKRCQLPYAQDINSFIQAYPSSYRFIIEAAIKIDYGCFISGVVQLKDMVFGGPSDYFIDSITFTTFKHKAYTIPFSDNGVPLPMPFNVGEMPHINFYNPFRISKDKSFY